MNKIVTTGAFFPDASDDTLGGRLSMARDAAGIALSALSSQLGIRRETLQSWESDRAEPWPSQLVRLAGILGVSPMWLMTGAGKGPTQVANGGRGIEALQNQLARLSEMHQESGRLIAVLQRQVEDMERRR